MATHRALATGLVLAASLLVSAATAELVARHFVHDGFYVWPPNLRRTSHPSAAMVGISGPSRFTTNSLGVRGPEPSGERYRLLAIGGSTTICASLDDEETWVQLTRRRLEAVLGAGSVWIGNAGRPGHATAQHLLQAQALLDRIPDTDAVLLLVGVNDFLLRASHTMLAGTDRDRPSPTPATEDPRKTAFAAIPLSEETGPWYRRTALARLWEQAHWEPYSRSSGQGQRRRELRRQASVQVDDIRGVERSVASYEKALRGIAGLVERSGARLFLITHPTLWSPDLPPALQERLMFGGPPLARAEPGDPFLSVAALAQGISLFNTATLRACAATSADCIDLASAIPADAELFWDDVHFTEEGARRAADHLAAALLESGVFRAR